MFSNVLVTVEEALAVAPDLEAVTIVAVRQESYPFGDTHLSAIYSGTFRREQFERLDFSRDNVLDTPVTVPLPWRDRAPRRRPT